MGTHCQTRVEEPYFEVRSRDRPSRVRGSSIRLRASAGSAVLPVLQWLLWNPVPLSGRHLHRFLGDLRGAGRSRSLCQDLLEIHRNNELTNHAGGRDHLDDHGSGNRGDRIC
jgi:hypothetical protein